MSSLEAMFEASSAYFQYVHVNERAAHVKIDRVSHRCRPLISPVIGWFSTIGDL